MKTFRQFLKETRENVKISTRVLQEPIEGQETPEQKEHWNHEDHFDNIMRTVIDPMTNGNISTANDLMKLKKTNSEHHQKVFGVLHSHMAKKFGENFTPLHTELTIGRVARQERP